jgi:DNA-binding XRE family transcriptional regulator
VPRSEVPGDFDAMALFAALDAQRQERGLTWRQVAEEIWQLSSELNPLRPDDHPIAPATITNVARMGDTSCQHALFFLRWLDRSPESFVPSAPETAPITVGPDRRPRWNLKALYAAMDQRRRADGLTWAALASHLGCTPSQVTGLRTARYATSMRLAMRICRWLDRPAADFVYAGRW